MMARRVVFAFVIVGVVSLMGYGFYEAFGGSDAEAHEDGRLGRWVAGTGLADGITARGNGRRIALAEEAPSSGQAGSWGGGKARSEAAPEVDDDREWINTTGTVVSLDGSELVLRTQDGALVTAGLGQLRYWESLGIVLQAGDEVRLVGFTEGEELEVQGLTVASTGQTVVLRDETGRPPWAGGGRWAAPAVSGSDESL
jgi:hypothetical protein